VEEELLVLFPNRMRGATHREGHNSCEAKDRSSAEERAGGKMRGAKEKRRGSC